MIFVRCQLSNTHAHLCLPFVAVFFQFCKKHNRKRGRVLQPLLDLDAVSFVAFGDQLLPYFEDTGTVVFFPSSEYVLSLTIIRSKSPERSAQTDVIQRTAEKSWYISAARTRVPRFGTRRRCFHLLPFAMVQKQNDSAYH